MTDEDSPKCPHGYEEGDHHWYGCMKVSPFPDEDEEVKKESSLQVGSAYYDKKLDITDRWYPR